MKSLRIYLISFFFVCNCEITIWLETQKVSSFNGNGVVKPAQNHSLSITVNENIFFSLSAILQFNKILKTSKPY